VDYMYVHIAKQVGDLTDPDARQTVAKSGAAVECEHRAGMYLLEPGNARLPPGLLLLNMVAAGVEYPRLRAFALMFASFYRRTLAPRLIGPKTRSSMRAAPYR
jgi:hypothetical protein